jgi:hypothetical protein
VNGGAEWSSRDSNYPKYEANPKYEAQLGVRQRALAVGGRAGCVAGFGGAGGLWLAGLAGGEATEGDLEAEGAELADVVGDLAADIGAALVVVGAEVLVSQAGVR